MVKPSGWRSTVLLTVLESNWLLPAKVTTSGYEPAGTLGVIEHVAVPVESVVPVQVFPASENASVTLPTPAKGVAEMST